MAIDIHKVTKRDALKPRREPYWGAPLGKGQALGFRKIDAQTGSWIARMRNETGHKVYKALGYVSKIFDYEKAREAANTWFKAQDAGVTSDETTIADACRQYVEDRKREKGEACAQDAKKRFDRTVYETPFGAIPLARVRTPRIKEWRDGLKLSKGSSNRTLTALKAALNLAVANRLVHPIAAREWADVKAYANAAKRRDLFLDLKQRRKLLQATEGALKDLMEAAALTGARAGELTSATRGQFDARLGTITFNGKTGARTIPLSPPALALFKRLAKHLSSVTTVSRGRTRVGMSWCALRPRRRSSPRASASTPCVIPSLRRPSRTG